MKNINDVMISDRMAWKILDWLGVKDSKITEATIHIKVDHVVVIDITRFATRPDGEFELTKDGNEIKTEMKRYELTLINK